MYQGRIETLHSSDNFTLFSFADWSIICGL